MPAVRVIGMGRAGGSFAAALATVGWDLRPERRHGDDLRDAAVGVDIVLIATPDHAIAEVAGQIDLVEDTAIVHVSGSLGLDVLAPHIRRGAVHPLVSLPTVEIGAARLTAGPWFAVAGDPVAGEIVTALGGRSFEVADEDRAAYHAAACIASNHLVALMGQVQRVAESVGVPLAAYEELAMATLANVVELGPAAALTGPAARGDQATIDRHRAALDDTERPLYDALLAAARRLVTSADPDR